MATDYKDQLFKFARTNINNSHVLSIVVSFLEDHTPEYFWTVPASSTGKYHPEYVSGDGGLVRHTLAVAKLTKHICGLRYLRMDEVTQDRMVAAAILHDTYKRGPKDEPEPETNKDHAWLASKRLTTYFLGSNAEIISSYIKSHAGEFGPSQPSSMSAFIVHLADYIASRKEVSIDVGASNS